MKRDKSKILFPVINDNYHRLHKRNHPTLGQGISIKFEEYTFPDISFKTLEALSEYFGTKDIDLNDWSYSQGCPTCGDYTVCYSIQIYNIKTNNPF